MNKTIMKPVNKPLHAALLCAVLMVSLPTQANELRLLENLERERAHLIELMLDVALDPDKRRTLIENKVRRLVDLERMVMRDKRLEGNTHINVQRAFKSYDLTFMAHASLEQKQSLVAHWVDQTGLSNDAIMTSGRGIR